MARLGQSSSNHKRKKEEPELVTSILAMGVALFLGLRISLPFWMASLWQARQPGDHPPSAEADPFLKQTSLYEAMVE
jgi:hypothetical protein